MRSYTTTSTEAHQHARPDMGRRVEYLPIGELLIEEKHAQTERSNYLFNGKELDTETAWYYYGARYYDPKVALWLSVDPLAEKYAGWSSYSYTFNNPINLIDPDGRRIRFAKGVSKAFKKAFSQAVKHLNKHKASGMMASLEKSPTIYYIQESEGKSSFVPKTNTIHWDPDMGIITNEGSIMSPTAVLNHEIDHANQKDKHLREFINDANTPDPDYENKEEKRVITGSEQETGKKLGEIKENEVTRKDHSGTPYETKGPTTTEGKYEVIIRAKREEIDN